MADNEASEKTPDPAPQSQETKDAGGDQDPAAASTPATEGAASLDTVHKIPTLKPSAPSGTKSVLRITPKLGVNVSNTSPSVLTKPLSPLSGHTKPVQLTDSAKPSSLIPEARKTGVPTLLPTKGIPAPTQTAATAIGPAKSALPKPAPALPSAARTEAAKPTPTKPEAGTALITAPISPAPAAPKPAGGIPFPSSPDKGINPIYEQTKTPISKPAEAKFPSPSLGQDKAIKNNPELASSKLEQVKIPLSKPVEVKPAPLEPKSSDPKPSPPTPVPAPKTGEMNPASSKSPTTLSIDEGAGRKPDNPTATKIEDVKQMKTVSDKRTTPSVTAEKLPVAAAAAAAAAAAEKVGVVKPSTEGVKKGSDLMAASAPSSVTASGSNPTEGQDKTSKPSPTPKAAAAAASASAPAKVVAAASATAADTSAPPKLPAGPVPAKVSAAPAVAAAASVADKAAAASVPPKADDKTVKKPQETSAIAEKKLPSVPGQSTSGLVADAATASSDAPKELVSKMDDLEIKQEHVEMRQDPADPAEVTKEGIRRRIWDYLEANNLVNFPRPVHNRIPNYKGASVAGDKMSTLDVFKKAQTVKINPDKPQEQCRFLTLEAHKTLLVPTPRLRQGLFNRINVPEDDQSKAMLKLCSTSQGIKEHSSPISLDSKVNIDLIIVGSVAVSKKGYRIGKGEGFADLEFGMMRAMEAVDDDIIVVTTVHDSQVTEIPDHLLQPHDLTVDFIVTPTEVIQCERRDKPKGIIWSMLTREKLSRVPILKKLRERQREAGIDVTLKDGEEPEASESNQEDHDRPRQRDRRRRRRNTRNRDSERDDNEKGDGDGDKGEHSETGEGNDKDGKRRERRNNNRRRRRRSTRKSEGEGGEGDTGPESGADGDKENAGDDRRRRPQRRRRRRSAKSQDGERSGDEEKGDGERKPAREGPRKRQTSGPLSTVYVGALPRSLRVSEFKAQVRDRGINPLRVIWHGASGHAFLQFTKKDEADSALDSLKDMEIEGKPVKVEMSKRGVKSGNPDEHQANNNNDINGEAMKAEPISDKE